MDPQTIFQTSIDVFRRNVMEHYVDLQGRVGRSEFWHFVLAVFVIDVVLAIIGSILGTRLLSSLANLALLLPNIGMGARRLHDVDKSAWYLLLPAVPAVLGVVLMLTIILIPFAFVAWIAVLACSVYLIYLYVQPGTAGSNQYGAEPPNPPAPAKAAT